MTMLRDPGFEVALDTLNVSSHFCGVAGTADPVDSFSFIPHRSFDVEIVEMRSAGGPSIYTFQIGYFVSLNHSVITPPPIDSFGRVLEMQ